jgi:acyl-CoA thioester hydrolase
MPATPELRASYKRFEAVPTRWMDNDVYGHVNNVVYYSYFDSVINRYLIEVGGLDIEKGEIIGLCVESHCEYLAPVSYPQILDAGMRVGKLGRSSVRYEIGIFAPGSDSAAAQGHFVHVFVGRESRRPIEIPERMRAAMTAILAG